MRTSIKKGLSVFAGIVLAFGSMPVTGVLAAGSITIDGNASDWRTIESQAVNGGQQVSGWKAAADNDNIYLMFTGTASSEWDYGWAGNGNTVTIMGGGKTETFVPSYDWNTKKIVIRTSSWQERNDTQVAFTNKAHQNSAAPYVVEMAVSKAQFGASFDINFAGTTLSSSGIQDLTTASASSSETPASQTTGKTTYEGIKIDGDFEDWDAVAKTSLTDPNSAHPNTINRASVVWDGDYLYLYVQEGPGGRISEAGSHNNGKFTIKSDLGYETLLQFNNDNTVSGIGGGKATHVGSEWEISIPQDVLPQYSKTLSFGFYLGDTIIDGVQNLDGRNNETAPKQDMAYDGSYGEWSQYPHTTIQYSTAGTQEMVVDASVATYMDGDYLRGHVVTGLPQHVQSAGGEFTTGVYMVFNSENPEADKYTNKCIPWRLVTVDGNGNINWNPRLRGLEPGTYEFYISSTDAWGSASNLSDVDEHNPIYGRVTMTIGAGGKDEMEFYMRMDKMAEHMNLSAGDLRIVDSQYINIGNQWVKTAGTSSGPVMGVIICIATVGAVFIFKRKRMSGASLCLER